MSGVVSFSLNHNKKTKKKKPKDSFGGVIEGFEQPPAKAELPINPDIPQEPLVIPVQQDGRKSLQEQAKLRREQQQQEQPNDAAIADSTTSTTLSKEDQAAIQALNAEAAGGDGASSETKNSSKLVIASTRDTFQGNSGNNNDQEQQEQFQQELQNLAPEVSVDSDVYQKVKIQDFGAAMLRGMGWTGSTTTNNNNDSTATLPRPSRLGLGATPKLLALDNAPTHSGGHRKKPRRQDQVERDKRLQQQQLEYEQQRLENLKKDKQRTIQVGSIVYCDSNNNNNDSRRAIIRKWQGVPGLNMILVQYEDDQDESATKVKRGSVRLVDRTDLEERPFREPYYKEAKTEYLGVTRQQQQQRNDPKDSDDDDRRHSSKDKERERRKRRRTNEDENDYDDQRRRRREDDRDSARRKRHRDEKYYENDGYDDYDRKHRRSRREKEEEEENRRRKKQRHREKEETKPPHHHRREERPPSQTWLVSNIRVRVVTSKLGREYYKEKGVVVDVTAKGTATLKMDRSGQVLRVPERYLETALPKVGGNACILVGHHKFAKGRLLERDSRANKGSVQVFEDMNIVTTSLDDMAEWCGPLDDDLME